MSKEKTDNNNGSAQVRTDASVQAVIKHAVEIGKITREQGEHIFWLHGYGMEHGLTNQELAERIGRSKTVISLLFSGKYDVEDWSPVIKLIENFRRLDTKQVRRADAGFIESDTAKTIFTICDNATIDHMPAFVYGASQLGKTRALEEYCRRMNSPNVKFIPCLPRFTYSSFLRYIAKKCNLRGLYDKVGTELLEEIAASLNPSSLLIFDEFNMLTETVSRDTSKALVESIRRIYDLSHCSLVICATKVALATLEEGPNRLLFDQFKRRGILKVVLPDVPSVKDINSFSRAFGLEAPHGETLGYIKDILKLRGLGVFLGYLAKAASKIDNLNRKAGADPATAGKDARVLDWEYFLKTARGFEALSNIESEY